MSMFVIVPGAWDTPATVEPVTEPLVTSGHTVTIVDLPCANPAATLAEHADAVREQPARLAELLVAAAH